MLFFPHFLLFFPIKTHLQAIGHWQRLALHPSVLVILCPYVKMQFLCQSHPPPSWTRGSDTALAGMEFYDVVDEEQKHHGKNVGLCHFPECATQPASNSLVWSDGAVC